MSDISKADEEIGWDDPRSWNYRRTYIRPKLCYKSTFLHITLLVISLVFLNVLLKNFAGLRNRLFLSALLLSCYTLIFLRRIVIFLIKLYQRFAPEYTRSKCRFEPSCSQYMILCLEKYPFLFGLKKGLSRIYRCSHGGRRFRFPIKELIASLSQRPPISRRPLAYSNLSLQNQRRRRVNPRAHLLVEHIEPLAVGAEEIHLLDVVRGVHLFLRLLAHEPV